ncbi:hypothetical protein FRB90_008938 [Tulasnella sp. 427]|nr:hypothetical protein FRB90_008938 [Tulasnella sp. 427]
MNSSIAKRYSLVLQQLHRWRSITLVGQVPEEMQDGFLALEAPNLRSIKIYHYPVVYDSECEVMIPSEGQCLSELILGKAFMDWSNPRIARLRILRLDAINDNGPSLLDVHKILSESPDLEFLSISGWDDWGEDIDYLPSTLEPVHLPSLATLIIDDVQSDVSKGLLAILKAPSCKYFHIREMEMSAFGDVLQSGDAQLLRAPLAAIPQKLFLSYDYGFRCVTISTDEDCAYVVPDIKRATSKLSDNCGVHVKLCTPETPGGDNASIDYSSLLSTIYERILQPALSELNIEVEFKISQSDNSRGPLNPFDYTLLHHLPFVTHLRLADTVPHHYHIIKYLSSPQKYHRDDNVEEEKWVFPRLCEVISEWDDSDFGDVVVNLDMLAQSIRVGGLMIHETGREIVVPLERIIIWEPADMVILADWTPESGWAEWEEVDTP